jgi:hypothetical protein
LETLARGLNDLTGLFRFAKEKAKQSNERADNVATAMAVLEHFFEEREREYRALSADSEIVKSERQLRDKFRAFQHAMYQQDDKNLFNLDMDLALVVPEHENWHSIAEGIAGWFILAMQATNPRIVFRYSNKGPVARFVAAVVPLITGEKTTVTAVSKHLKGVRKKKHGGQTER